MPPIEFTTKSSIYTLHSENFRGKSSSFKYTNSEQIYYQIQFKCLIYKEYAAVSSEDLSVDERRRYPRVTMPVYCRPARLRAGHPPQQLLDIGLGGVRVYSDEQLVLDERLEIELFFADNTSMSFTVKVVWINVLSEDNPAHYEVGLEFIEIESHELRRLKSLLYDNNEELEL